VHLRISANGHINPHTTPPPWSAPPPPCLRIIHVNSCIDVHRHGLRPVQLGLLPRWPQLPGTFSRVHLFERPNSLSQVEYAVKAVENGGTAVGIRCKDGVVLALEKLVTSKLLKAGANKRIATVDRNMGIVSSGLLPDGRHFVSRARDEAAQWRQMYKAPIPVASLADRMGSYAQAYTLYSSVRPFGITAIIAGWDSEAELPVDAQVGSGPKAGSGGKKEGAKHGGPSLYMIEPSGLYWVSCLLLCTG
jgi:20S proteasome alpha/beta subunit